MDGFTERGQALALWGGKRENRSPEEVVAFLDAALSGAGDGWAWDDFIESPITDPALDRIRKAATRVGPPDIDYVALQSLRDQAAAMVRRP